MLSIQKVFKISFQMLIKNLLLSGLLINKIKISQAVDLSNGVITINIDDDFDDSSIQDQIFTNNVGKVNVGSSVTELRYFSGIEMIKTFNIQSQNVNKIPDHYFYGSRNIETVTFVNNIVIGVLCFEQSTIKNIDFSKVTEIQSNAFRYCYNIKSINLLQSITLNIYSFAYSGLESVILPDSISLEPFCFYSCTNLTSIEFKGSCTIGHYAFADCFKLSNVTPSLESIESFGSFSFRGCSIKNVRLGQCELNIGVFQNSKIETVDAIDIKFTSKEFRGCRKLRYVNISGKFITSTDNRYDRPPEYFEYYALNEMDDILRSYHTIYQAFGNYEFQHALLFEDCISLEVFKANNMPEVIDSCFRNCLKLKEISINAHILSPWAFMNCVSLESINIASVDSIGDGCFG